MSTNLEELKRLRENNFLKHKKKKRDYYLKSKERNIDSKYKEFKEIDYEKELNSSNFTKNIKIIAKKQKKHIDDRKEQILQKMSEYKEKKQAYYKDHREERLEYDKVYRENKKDALKEYRREYYKKNKESILERQKNKRKKRIIDGK